MFVNHLRSARFVCLALVLVACNSQPSANAVVTEQTGITATNNPPAAASATAVATAPSPAATETADNPPAPTDTAEGTTVATRTPRPTATTIAGPTTPPLPTPGEPLPVSWSGIGTPVPPASEPITPENVSGLVEVGRWGKGRIMDAAYSPDGGRLFVLTEQGLYLYETATAAVSAFHSHTGRPVQMALSPDGQKLALSMGAAPFYVEVRDANTFTLLGAFYPFDEPEMPVANLLFDSSGRHLFAHAGRFIRDRADVPPAVTAWDAASLTRVARLEGAPGFAYAAGADLAVSAISDEALQLWRWQDQSFSALQEIPVPEALDGWNLLALSPDGEYLAVSGTVPSSRIAVMRAESGELLYVVNSSRRGAGATIRDGRWFRPSAKPALVSGPGRDYPQQLLFSPDSEYLGATTGYYDLTLWHAESGATAREWAAIGYNALFHPNQALVAAWRHTLSQWQIDDGAPVNSLAQHIGPITDLALLSRRNQVAIASNDGTIYLRQLQTGDLVASLHAGVSNETGFIGPSVSSLDVTADEQTLASASNDAYRLWNLADYSMTRLSPIPRSDIGADRIVVSPNGQYIVGAEFDTAARLWTDGKTEASEAPFPWLSAFSPAAFSPVAPLLAADTYDGLLLWQPAADEVSSLPSDVAEGHVVDLVFSTDGRYLAGTMSEEGLLVWEIEGAAGRLLFSDPPGELYSDRATAAFSIDNGLLAHSVRDQVRFWDMSEESLLYTLDTGICVTALAFTADGRFLVTGHSDGSVRFWKVQ